MDLNFDMIDDDIYGADQESDKEEWLTFLMWNLNWLKAQNTKHKKELSDDVDSFKGPYHKEVPHFIALPQLNISIGM